MSKNVLKIRNNTLFLEGFEKIKEKVVVSFLSSSIVFYPYQGQELRIGQTLYDVNEKRFISDGELANQIKNHLGVAPEKDMELSFMDSPIYELNRDSYICLPSKQKLPV